MILANLQPSKSCQSSDAETQVETKNSKWLAYIGYITKLKLFIRSERTGNWNLHLLAVRRMQNLFTVTENFNYTNSARVYLQWILEFPEKILGFINSSQKTGFICATQ